MAMKLGSLFDGSGGFPLAGILNGMEPVWASEIEPYPLRVTATRLPQMKQLGDVTKIDGSKIESVDIITFGSPCFPAGTLVNTINGFKPIEEIRVTDQVLTHKGVYRQVLNAQYTGVKKVFRLRAMGVHEIRATGNHLFWAKATRDAEPSWIELWNLTNESFICAPRLKTERNEMQLTPEECWLIGRYIADGYTRSGQRMDRPDGSRFSSVVFCVGKGKEVEFEQELLFYKAGKCAQTGGVTKYTVNSHRLVQLCEACGRHAENKELPGFLLDLPAGLLKRVIAGYMSGDGCKVGNVFKATSVSERLMYSLAQAIEKCLGVPCRIYRTDVPETTIIEGRTVHQRTQWQLAFKADASEKDRAFSDGDYIWFPVRRIEDTDEYLPVYDITVAEEHSFCVQNIAVHNCQDISVAGKQAGIHEGQRSSLFFEAVRIIKEMRYATANKFPRFAVWENVPGAFSSGNGEDFRAVLEALGGVCEDGLSIPRPKKWNHAGCVVGNGWSLAWRVYDAQYWGVPQRRKRIYVIADFGSERAGEILFERESLSGDSAQGGEAREAAAADAEGSAGRSDPAECLNKWDCQSKRILAPDGVSDTLCAAEKRPAGPPPNVCYPAEADESGRVRCLNPWDSQTQRLFDSDGVWPSLSANSGGGQNRSGVVCPSAFMGGQGAKARSIAYCDDGTVPTLKSAPSGGNTVPDVCYSIEGHVVDRQSAQNGRGWAEGRAHTLNATDRHVVAMDCRNMAANDELSGTLQAKPNGGQSLNYISPVVYDARGNGDGGTAPTLTGDHQGRVSDYTGVACFSQQWFDEYAENDVASSLKARDYKDVTDLVVNQKPRRRYIVRRLTPLECCRLQGFPDWWEDGIEGSDSARYKMWGNGIALPCAYDVLRRVAKAMAE